MTVTVERGLAHLGEYQRFTGPDAVIANSRFLPPGIYNTPQGKEYLRLVDQGWHFKQAEKTLSEQGAVPLLKGLAEELLPDENPHISVHRLDVVREETGEKLLGYAVVLQWNPSVDLQTPQRGIYIAATEQGDGGVWLSTGNDKWQSVRKYSEKGKERERWNSYARTLHNNGDDPASLEARARFAIDVVRTTPIPVEQRQSLRSIFSRLHRR